MVRLINSVVLYCLGSNDKNICLHGQYRHIHCRSNYRVRVNNNKTFFFGGAKIFDPQLVESADAELAIQRADCT